MESPVAFSLTATTGAGKTVMAAAVIEALFDGNPDYDFDSDPGAVVLWFTDDPSLNEQTRFRLLDAADRIAHSRLVVIENTFNQKKLEPGKVYFLNAQKLGKKSLLVRGAPESLARKRRSTNCRCRTRGRSRCGTRWRTPSPTSSLTLYLILDEAHRGMKPPSRARPSREGHHRAAARQRRQRRAARPHRVGDLGDGGALRRGDGKGREPDQATLPWRSTRRGFRNRGLLKDDIRLDFPPRPVSFDTVLLAAPPERRSEPPTCGAPTLQREGASRIRWCRFLVVQVPNTPSDELLLSAFTTIRENLAGAGTGRDGACLRRSRGD